jgi:hypothetical protein
MAYSYVDKDTPIGKGTVLWMLSQRYHRFFRIFQHMTLSLRLVSQHHIKLTTRLLVLKLLYKLEVRFPYTADTYNDPQNLWIFA